MRVVRTRPPAADPAKILTGCQGLPARDRSHPRAERDSPATDCSPCCSPHYSRRIPRQPSPPATQPTHPRGTLAPTSRLKNGGPCPTRFHAGTSHPVKRKRGEASPISPPATPTCCLSTRRPPPSSRLLHVVVGALASRAAYQRDGVAVVARLLAGSREQRGRCRRQPEERRVADQESNGVVHAESECECACHQEHEAARGGGS